MEIRDKDTLISISKNGLKQSIDDYMKVLKAISDRENKSARGDFDNMLKNNDLNESNKSMIKSSYLNRKSKFEQDKSRELKSKYFNTLDEDALDYEVESSKLANLKNNYEQKNKLEDENIANKNMQWALDYKLKVEKLNKQKEKAKKSTRARSSGTNKSTTSHKSKSYSIMDMIDIMYPNASAVTRDSIYRNAMIFKEDRDKLVDLFYSRR